MGSEISSQRINIRFEGSTLSDEQLRAAVDAAALGVWDWDIEQDVLHWSDRMRSLFGVGPEAPVSYEVSFLGALHPDDRPRVKALVAAALAAPDGQYKAEYRLVGSDDPQPRWIEATGRCYFRSGQPVRLVGTARDITAAKLSQSAAEERNLLLELTRSAVGVGYWEFDLLAGVASLDRFSLEMHGLPPDHPGKLTQQQWGALLEPTDAQRALTVFQEAIRDDKVYDVIFRTAGSPERPRWVHGLARALYDAQGRAYRMIGLNIDVTARKEAELELHRLHEDMLRTSRLSAMGALAATFAHELNQPLTSVSNYLAVCKETLSRPAVEVEGLHDVVERALRQTRRAGEIIRRIRKFTLSGEVSAEPVALAELVSRAWLDTSSRPEAANISLSTDFDAELKVKVDPVQIGQVLVNLLRNASDALSGTPAPKITVTAHQSGETVRVLVSDNGPGLECENPEQLFEPFRTSKQHGTGLGLPICRTIVELHGGKIWAENANPAGAVFVIILPADPVLS